MKRAEDSKQSLLKRNSMAQILLGIWRHRPISRAQLARATGISMRTTCTLVDEMIEQGTLVEVGTVTGSRGRPSMMLDINPAGPPVAGVFLTPTIAEVVVSNSAGEFLARRSVPLDSRKSTQDEFISGIVDGISRCAEAAGTSIPCLSGVGLSISDQYGRILGTIESRYGVPGWDGLPIVSLLTEALRVPVHAETDMRAIAMWSESFEDSTSGSKIFICVINGIGFAYADKTGVLRGAHDLAGQLEHIPIEPNGPLCKCGNRGCLLAVASDSVFIRQLWPDLPDDLLDVPIHERSVLMQRGFDMAMQGNEKALNALNHVLHSLALGVATVVNLFDPHIVYVFGNLIEPAPDTILNTIRRDAIEHFSSQVRGVEIKCFRDWMDVELRGSTWLVLGQAFRDLHELNSNSNAVTNLGKTRMRRATSVAK